MAVEQDVGVLTTRMCGILVGLALGEAIEHESESVISLDDRSAAGVLHRRGSHPG